MATLPQDDPVLQCHLYTGRHEISSCPKCRTPCWGYAGCLKHNLSSAALEEQPLHSRSLDRLRLPVTLLISFLPAQQTASPCTKPSSKFRPHVTAGAVSLLAVLTTKTSPGSEVTRCISWREAPGAGGGAGMQEQLGGVCAAGTRGLRSGPDPHLCAWCSRPDPHCPSAAGDRPPSPCGHRGASAPQVSHGDFVGFVSSGRFMEHPILAVPVGRK